MKGAFWRLSCFDAKKDFLAVIAAEG